MTRKGIFESASQWLADKAGSAPAFTLALSGIAVWAASGPLWGFNDTWQLVVNTGTTIITFLMVFLIQNTQNRDTDEIHIKLDELLHATQGAHDHLLSLEDRNAEELKALREQYIELGRKNGDQP